MTEIPALKFIITVKGGRKILDYERITDWCKKGNDLRHFEIPRAPFEFPLVLILSPSMLSRLSLVSAFLRTRGTLSLATRANCVLRTWNWAVGTSFLSPMHSGEPVNVYEDYCVSYCRRFQRIHTTRIIYLISYPDLTLSLEMWDLVKFDFEHAQCQRGPKYGLFFQCACSYSLLWFWAILRNKHGFREYSWRDSFG